MSEPLKEIMDAARESWHVGAAFMGALVSQSYWNSLTGLRAIINTLIGFAVACFSAPILTYLALVNWPQLVDARDELSGALHFWCGVLGMQIVPLVSKFINSLPVGRKDNDAGGDK